ncbi:MAG: polysaccharide biosynthesis protein [Myxococcales bacterium]|nr:polysaccharide biosynthesis protein [Myxococcales bacterium]
MKPTVLITGGSGFLGRRLGKALRDRYKVFLCARNQHQNTLAEKFSGCPSLPVDVARYESIRDAVIETRPDILVHAAATKYVDLGEKYPLECIDVNVLGSQNVAKVAIERKIPVVVGISTDKATPPIRNTYGMTKAVMERLFLGLDGQTSTKFLCTRFGNIAWSVGSVFPVWQRMQEDTGVIGTTGPEMRRFFFTVAEAVNVVENAIENADELHGSILGRRMKSAMVKDILDQWVIHRGGTWKHIEGRPGERQDEYLIGDLELPFTRAVTFKGVPHYAISFRERQANPPTVALTSENADRLTTEEIVDMITRSAEIERS